ncbi:MAG: phosphate ABC transporter permease subunit PstC [Gaiellaceae bacterium]
MELRAELGRTRRVGDRAGDGVLYGLTAAASIAAVLLVGAIAWKIVSGAWPSMRHFGVGFVWSSAWNPVTSQFGALQFLEGTLITSFCAVLLAAPLSIAIGLFLSELAPPSVRGPIGTLVEMLAAVPSVVIGLWGILMMGPWVARHVEPFLASWLGWIPIFSGSPQQSGMLPAILVLTIMIIPITSAICRDLFVSVPRELEEGALALGSTRWEMVRGVVLPYAKGGVVAAVILGLGRALGEAIAVTQVIGNADHLSTSFFAAGDTLASRIANQYQGAVSQLQIASLVYLAVVLLAITLVTNVAAQLLVRRFEHQRTGGS